MSDETFMDRLERVLEAMSLKTFDAPMTLDYRFGSFEAEEGLFRCFVNEDDVERTLSYLEIKGDQVNWVALDFPSLEEVMENIVMIGNKCRKTLGRHHVSRFIIAIEEGLGDEKEKLIEAFEKFSKGQGPGIYYYLQIWDDEGLRNAERELVGDKTP